nr:septal ring lytic transglycosylase RlpA family protein [Umezawaea tangerina]
MPEVARKRRWTIAAGLLVVVGAGAGSAFAMGGGAASTVACQGQNLTFFSDTAAPGVTSNQFPVGTQLKITNLDNGKSTTVPVTGVSGSCALLNTAAMDQVRETGKNVIRNNKVEVVSGGGAAQPGAGQPAAQPAPAAGASVCPGNLTFFSDNAAPGVTSNKFPVGTQLKITNLDNKKSTTVPVIGTSASCALLNTAAMDQVREAGKNVIRNNTVEVVGGGAAAQPAAGQPAAANPPAAAQPATGQVVCAGSTVTLSGEGGAPGASSNQFPVGTQLKITNLDNNKSTTVSVTSVSGSCALLNNAAFEQVREPGKFLIRNARIEKIG